MLRDGLKIVNSSKIHWLTPVDSQASFDWVVRTGAVPAPLGGYGTRELIKLAHPGLKSLCEYLQSTGEIGDKQACRDF